MKKKKSSHITILPLFTWIEISLILLFDYNVHIYYKKEILQLELEGE